MNEYAVGGLRIKRRKRERSTRAYDTEFRAHRAEMATLATHNVCTNQVDYLNE